MHHKIMENQYEDLTKLTELLKRLVDSYRLLIGGAAELNNINKRKNSAVSDALDRVDDLGSLIDDLIDVIEGCEKNYIKLSKIKNEVVTVSNEKNKVKHEFENQILTEVTNELNFQNDNDREEDK